jgi:hypothetical protein
MDEMVKNFGMGWLPDYPDFRDYTGRRLAVFGFRNLPSSSSLLIFLAFMPAIIPLVSLLIPLIFMPGRSSSVLFISLLVSLVFIPGRSSILPFIVLWFNLLISLIPMWRGGSLGPPVFCPPIMIPIPVSLPLPSIPVFLKLSVGNMPIPRRYLPVVRGQADHGPGDTAGLHENPWPIVGTGPEPVVLVRSIPVPAEKQNIDIDGRREIHIGPGDRNHRRRDRDH